MPTAPRLAAALAVPALALLWGLNWPAVRVVLGWWSPWELRSVGLGGAAVILFALAWRRGLSLRIARAQWTRVVVSSLLTVVGFTLCTAFAQLAGSTARAAIVTFTMPVWTVLLAWWLIGERPDRRRAFAVVVGLLGLGLLALPLMAKDVSLAGPAFALAAGFSWAAGTVFVKRHPIAAPAITSTAWQLGIAALVAIVGWLVLPPTMPPAAELAFPPLWFALALAFHVFLSTALAYVLWFDVVARLPAGVAAMGTLLVPVVGVLGAMALLGERPSATDLGGFSLIITAAALALLPRRAAAIG